MTPRNVSPPSARTRANDEGACPVSVVLRLLQRIYAVYSVTLIAAVRTLTFVAGAAVIGMMAVTTADVLLRKLASRPIPGAFDIVTVLGALTIACALPYTTAVKGHVAVEYFFHKLSRPARIVVDTANRLLGILLFGLFAWRSALYAASLKASGHVTPTLQLPLFPVVYAIAVSCMLVALVILHNLLHPGREMIKP